MTPPPKVDHVDVAAYVLGILDEPDEAAFAQHFARCPRCRDEYRELSDLPMLLDQLKPARPRTGQTRAPAAPGKRVLGQAIDRVTEARQKRIRTLWLAAAAVIVTLVAVPLIVLRSTGSGTQVAGPTVTVSSPAPSTTSSTPETGTDVVAGARTVSSENPTSGVKATVGIEPQPWGTKINLELRAGNSSLACLLVAVSRSGDTQVVNTWRVPPGGVGVPGAPASEPLRLEGGVGFSSDDIVKFEVRTTDGPILLSIPA